MTASKGILLALSGGLDSCAVLATIARYNGDVQGFVQTVGFEYGSKHGRYERNAACRVAAHYKLVHYIIDLSGAFFIGTSALLLGGMELPEGHYEEESMRKTVVPGRNLIFASILASIAEAQGCDAIYLGVHAGDHHIYPDCRPAFVASLIETVKLSTDGKVAVRAPFLGLTKADIVKHGLEAKAPFHLTRTCYSNDAIACGKCGSCQERLEAFALNGVEDPILYETRELLPKKGG